MSKLLRQLSTTSKDNLSRFHTHHTMMGELGISCSSSPIASWVRRCSQEDILVLDMVRRAG